MAAAGLAAPSPSSSSAQCARAFTVGGGSTSTAAQQHPPPPEWPARALSEGAENTLVALRGLLGEDEARAIDREEREELLANVAELCQGYGRVVSVRLALDAEEEKGAAVATGEAGAEREQPPPTGSASGPAVLVRFETAAVAQRAVTGLSARVVQGQRLAASLVVLRDRAPAPAPPPSMAQGPFGGLLAAGGGGGGSTGGSPRVGTGPYAGPPSSNVSVSSSAGGGGGISPYGSSGGVPPVDSAAAAPGGGGGGGGDGVGIGVGSPDNRRFPPKYADAATVPKLRGEQALRVQAGGGGGEGVGPAASQSARQGAQGGGGGGGVGSRADAVMCTEELEEQVGVVWFCGFVFFFGFWGRSKRG